MSYLELHGIAKTYKKDQVLHPTTLNIELGEFICFLGPSGSGKTTLLNCISGVIKPSEGSVILDGNDITYKPLELRSFGVVFQHYVLFPNLTVFENTSYGLSNINESKRNQRACEVLNLVGLEELKDRLPYQLSGGQQQRVALARALAPSPKLLLMDEPLSALDANIREKLGEDLRRLQKKLGITTIMVTHDQREAFALADRVAVMHDGNLEQIGNSSDIYLRPKSRFIAEFIGNMNIIENDNDVYGIRFEDVLIREPTEFVLNEEDTYTAKIEDIRFFGSYSRIYCTMQDMSTKIIADLVCDKNFYSSIVAITLPKNKRVSWS